jgi:hypothetical protein
MRIPWLTTSLCMRPIMAADKDLYEAHFRMQHAHIKKNCIKQ